MEKLFTLLELQRKAQESPSRPALIHVMVNDTYRLVPYAQAFFWSYRDGQVRLEKISGNAVLEPEATYNLEIAAMIAGQVKEFSPRQRIVRACPENETRHVLLLGIITPDGETLGGIWIEHTDPYPDADLHLLEELALTYAQCLELAELRERRTWIQGLRNLTGLRRYIPIAILLLCLFPVRLTVTAPAEIISREAEVVTVPFDGIIEDVEVSPGDRVDEGQLLLTMEHTALKGKTDIAGQELISARSTLARLKREALANPEKKSDLKAYEEEVKAKEIEYDFASKQSEKSELRAARSGVAVFSDPHSLKGKPVSSGDKVMEIADPERFELLIRIPADAMIEFDQRSNAGFYLNVAPLANYRAVIRSIGYQASLDEDGLLTYKVHASPETHETLRIGLKGTAEIRGRWTILSYAVLRRPLASLRRLTGL